MGSELCLSHLFRYLLRAAHHWPPVACSQPCLLRSELGEASLDGAWPRSRGSHCSPCQRRRTPAESRTSPRWRWTGLWYHGVSFSSVERNSMPRMLCASHRQPVSIFIRIITSPTLSSPDGNRHQVLDEVCPRPPWMNLSGPPTSASMT